MIDLKTIGIVSPSSGTTKEKIKKGIEKLEKFGYIVNYNHIEKKPILPFLDKQDALKIEEINGMFRNPEIDIILTRNGGYGSPRYVDQLDYQMIKEHPKPFCGFSDVSLLLNAIYLYTGITTYHGPMLTVDFANDNQEIHIDSFFKAIHKEEYTINKDNEYEIDVLSEGISEGILVGGNLSLLNVFIAMDFKDYFKDKILLIEEVNEPLYRIDRMLQTLRLNGVFEDLKGVIIGGISEDKTPQKGSKELFQDLLNDYEYPILFNAPIGHVTPRYTVPIGGKVRIDTSKKSITVLGED